MAILAGTRLFTTPAAAHGSSHAPDIPQELGLVTLAVGIALFGLINYRSFRDQTPPSKMRVVGLLTALSTIVVGAVILIELSQIETLTSSQLAFDRDWYPPLSVGLAAGVAIASLAIGRLRWPQKPRYAGLGILLAAWIGYSGVMTLLIGASKTLSHPLGYLIVGSVPFAVGYILWRDTRQVIRTLVEDSLAVWFGVGVGILMTVFFLFSTGMVGIIPDNPDGISWTYNSIVTIPVANPLVYWSAIEWWFPHVPFGGYVSVGMALVLGLLGTLISLNAALMVNQWRTNRSSSGSTAAPGAAAIAGPNACCCCGPVLAELIVVAIGPSAAAPLYWVFVDIASPVGSVFFTGSIVLLLSNLVRVDEELAFRAAGGA